MRKIKRFVQDYTARQGQNLDSNRGPLTPDLETKVKMFFMKTAWQNYLLIFPRQEETTGTGSGLHRGSRSC